MPILLSNLLDEKILINNFLMNQFSRKNRQDKKITVSDWMNKIFTNIKKRSSIDFRKTLEKKLDRLKYTSGATKR